ncbi:hypothetical protein M409DRAFT_70432 [Zasmidium cellare ATCC 36951]|uniref:Major facilitator superfamily (MFS) profile domain-containing protein n=1 Tax=Zasmidium cellare ATCC 36951 TaxID=1080233 RepID=A0A6A6C505_ZASCE|nr:uncharacterized protein M409DRAFT_70432 [Zasmidium cellare ATCC 36951]KAF2160466.1 hypothetical protein M409DRAFT_70432 [Zasmidium cellare ATCC 36951]
MLVTEKFVQVPSDVATELYSRGFKFDSYGVVTFSDNSKIHPRRWGLRRKIYDSALICFLELFMTLISNTGSSIALESSASLGLGRTVALVCFTTVYMFGQALGGLVFPPMAESFGGRTIYVSTTFGYAIFCLITAAWPNVPCIIIGRFGSGFLSAMPAVVAAGSIENMWDLKARIWLIHIWIATAVLGLALGPPIATYVSTSSYGWPWIFYVAACVAAVSAILCFGMRESRPSRLLRQQVRLIAKKTSFDGLSVEDDETMPNIKTFIRTSLTLPVRLFIREPIILLTSIMAGTVYGVTYLFSEAFPVIYTDGYGFTHRQASLVFIAIAVGVAFSILPRFYDICMTKRRRRQRRFIEPEDKLFGFYLAAPVLAIGLWWFAWTVPPLIQGVSPWASIVSVALFGFAVVEFDNVLSGYLTDTYATYAASANAPMAFLRAALSRIFPLFGTQMFSKLGANNALFILAGVATAYCAVAAWFGLNGKNIRQRSPFAEKTWAASQSSERFLYISAPIQRPEKCIVIDGKF